ncbi:TPA: 2Fe-2S iron-sulfur cluster binding domain-containing protein [Klebsiella pneumoniae]|nr:2Fe-2S iron-sulfur cluster binding domain-containing protein [Klebsiella pneumoniae]
MNSLNQEWYVIASSEDVPFRHVYQTRLLGQELAVWRDDTGTINAWENRCPHRGVRLTLGVNLGDQLQCQYHGWKYESGTGQCSFVPAHRTVKPSNACVRTFQCTEADGMVYARITARVGPFIPTNEGSTPDCVANSLRSHVVSLRASDVLSVLQKSIALLAPVLAVENEEVLIHSVGLTISLTASRSPARLMIFIQPESDSKAIVHARLYSSEKATLERRVLFTDVLTELFDDTHLSVAVPDIPSIIATDATLHPAAPNSTPVISKDQFWCTVIHRITETPDIDSFWLKPDTPRELMLEPGMHASLITPSGHLRQYSIVNTPDERDIIVIGVKNEHLSRGGSRSMHTDVHIGTKILVSIPKNQFALQPAATKSLLIAGGIGVTPVLAMALHLERLDRPFSFHYLVRGKEHVAFQDRIAMLGASCTQHLGLDIDGTRRTIIDLLQQMDATQHHVYVCGPQPMIELVVGLALETGFSSDQVHYEYFGLPPGSEATSSAVGGYQVKIHSTGHEFIVEPGKTLLQTCLEQGINIDYSCEQGVCGACATKVVSGDLLHHDVYLSAKEKESGKVIMPCVSGCTSKKLILDI